MRKSRNGQVRAFAVVAKFSVLLMCFATIFALVLTTGVFDVGGSDMSANVADAEHSGGSTSAISLDSADNQNATVHNAMHGNSTAAQTFTYDLSNYDFSEKSTSLYNDSDSGTNIIFWHGQTHKGNVDRNDPADLNDDGYDHAWGVGGDSWYAIGRGGTNYAAINVTIPTIIQNYRKAGFTVTAYYTATLYGYKAKYSDKDTYIGIYASDRAQSANTYGNGQMQNKADNYENGINRTSVTLTLAENSTNLTLYIGRGITTTNAIAPDTNGSCRSSMICAANTKVVFTVTPKPSSMPSDGNAPSVSFMSGTTNTWLGSGNLGGFMSSGSALFDEIAGHLDSTTDSSWLNPSDNAGSISLAGVVAKKNSLEVGEEGVSDVSSKYAKKAVFTVKERNANSGEASIYEPGYYAGLAGIKAGNAPLTGTIYNSSYLSGEFTYTATGGGTGNGYYYWKVNDQGRTAGTLTLYFNDNAENIEVLIYDSGGSYFTLNIKVDGIKDGGDDLTGSASITDGTRMKDGNSATFDGLTWEWNNLTPDFANMGSGLNEQIWFYAVERYDSADAALEALGTGTNLYQGKTGSSGLQPIGYSVDGALTRFSGTGYDFDSGTFDGAAPINGGSATGSGWYRFEFYPMNYAGYIGKPVVRLVKADVAVGEVEVVLTYSPEESGTFGRLWSAADTKDFGRITFDEAGAYVGTDLTAKVTFAPNFSGNRVHVLGADGQNYIVYVSGGKITGIYGADGISAADDWKNADGVWSMAEGTAFGGVKVSVAEDEDGKVVLSATYTGLDRAVVEEVCDFRVYSNADDNGALDESVSNMHSEWGSGATLNIDLAAPAQAVSGNGFVIKNDKNTIPAGTDRKWYTDSNWTLDADMTVTGEYDTLYYVTQYYKGTVGQTQGSTDFSDGLKNYQNIYNAASLDLTGFTDEDHFGNDGKHSLHLDFGEIAGKAEQAGYYVVYIVVKDRAGNVSELGVFGVLADGHEYKISVEIDQDTLDELGNSPYDLTRIVTDEEGNVQTTFRRGETIRFVPKLTDESYAGAYVPYEIKKYNAETGAVIDASPIYSHEDDDITSGFNADYILSGYAYARLIEGGSGLELDVDRNSVANLPIADGGQTKLVFSYRRVMKATYNLNVSYTGEEITAEVTELFTDGNPAQSQSPDGPTITAKPYKVVYPGNFVVDGITHAGSYAVQILRQKSEFYVLSAEVTDNLLTVTPVALNVAASMNPTGGAFSFHFGDMTPANAQGLLGLQYDITSGLVGQDKDKAFEALYEANIAVSISNMPEGSYVALGPHTVTATLTAKDYTVTLTWGESGGSFNIVARPMSFTVQSPASVTYGDPMPAEYTVRLLKSAFAFDSAEQGGLELYQTAEQVKALIGYDVTDDGGDYYEFKLPASAFAAFEKNDAGLYNVGDHPIADFNQGSTSVNNRLALRVAEDSEGKVTVTTRTVEVSPVGDGTTIDIEKESEIADLTFNISATAETDAYRVTGVFVAGESTGTENVYYIVAGPDGFGSAHNEYDENNVEVKVADGEWTFTVHYITPEGQFVITFNAGIFTVTYGELFDADAIAAAGGGYYTVEYFPRDGEGGYATEPAAIPTGVTLDVTIGVANYNTSDAFANNAGNYNLTVSAQAQGAPEGVFYTYAYKTADGALPAYVTVKTLQATVKVSEGTPLSKEYGVNDPAIDPEAFGFDFSDDNGLIDEFIKEKGEISVKNIGAGWDRLAKVGSDYKYDWSGCTFTAGNDTIISSNNIKFTVVDDGVRFKITQKVLNIDALIGNGGLIVTAGNKPYNGNSTANATLEFGSVGENSVIINEDKVTLSYTAEYWNGTQTVSDISSGEGYHIIFHGIGISGADAGNYRLEGGDTVEGFEALVFITPESGYQIDPNPINILTEYFTVSKIYDGNTGVTTGNIKITGLSLGRWELLEDGSFAAAQAGITMASFVIVFPDTEYPQAVLDPDGGRGIEDYYKFDTAYFSVEQSDEGGIKLICSNIDATIGKKAINLGDIEFKFTAKDMTKEYDGTAGFDVPFGFTDAFAGSVTGFVAENVGLSFEGSVSRPDVAEYPLIIDSIGLDDDVNYEIGETLTAENAALRINDGRTPFSITPKKLRLDIVFAEASYSGKPGPTTASDTPVVIRGLENGETAVIKDATYEYVRPVVGEDGTVKYEAFPYVQTGEGYYDGATYLHDVRAGFVIAVGNGFKWENYKLDVKYEATSTPGEYNVSGLILEKAAVLNPAEVTLNVTVSGDYITVNAKTYDATNVATITIGEAAYRDEFHGEDFSHLDFSYTATFTSVNAGSGIDVSVSELALIAEDGYEYIADSYKIAADSRSFTLKNAGTINKAPVKVQLNIPEKVYDGTRYVELSPGANIGTLLNVDGSADWAVAGEKFAGNYSVQAIAAGYDDANVASGAGYAKTGTVIGFKLVNDMGGAVNYYIVDADKNTAYFNAYSEEALGDKLEGALAYIEGVYSDGGELRYIIRKDDVTAAGVDGIDPVTTFTANYAEGEGAIEPATVSFSVVIVDKPAFRKQFDDTSALPDQPVYGTKGDAEGTYDFYIRLSDGGTGFSFQQSDFVIRLAGAEVGNQDIIFTISRSEIGNYIFNTDNSVTVPGGEITKGKSLSVTATSSSGGDITGTYGDVGLDHTVKYTYQGTGSNPVTLTVADGYAYVLEADWKTLFEHNNVPDEVNARRYNYADGKWTQVDDGAYIRITGTFGTPVLSTAGGTSFVDRDGVVTAAAGTYENAKLSVTSQSFTLNTPSNIKVVISPRTLQVFVTNANEQGNFTADYFVGKLPKPVFALLNESEVASIDNKNEVLGSVHGVFMNVNDGQPVANLNINKDGNYVLAVSSDNGNYAVVLVGADGESAEHKLVVTIPALSATQYKIANLNTRPYELDEEGDPVALDASDLLVRYDAAMDEIVELKWTTKDGTEVESGAPTDAGEYKWSIKVQRKIGGTYGYCYDGVFEAEGTFTITQRKINVSLREPVDFTYGDDKKHSVTKEMLVSKDVLSGTEMSQFIEGIGISYTFKGEPVEGNEMINAGGYTVVLDFTANPNYVISSNITVYVKAKPVTVTVNEKEPIYDVAAGITGITFSASGGMSTEDFTVEYRNGNGMVVDSVTTPGVYTYTIRSNSSNYIVNGDSTGKLSIGVSKVTYTKNDVDYVTIDFGELVTVNYRINDIAVSDNSSYWKVVDSNVKALAGEDGDLITNGILRLEVEGANGIVTNFSKGVTVTARIPEGVGADFALYRVTSAGGLELVTDYTVANGTVTYTTDYISSLVFVGNAPAAGFTQWWIIPVIAAALILLIAAAILIAVLVKLHRAPEPIPVEVAPIDSIMPAPPAPAAPVIVNVPAADIEPVNYDAPAAVSRHRQPPIIGIR